MSVHQFNGLFLENLGGRDRKPYFKYILLLFTLNSINHMILSSILFLDEEVENQEHSINSSVALDW